MLRHGARPGSSYASEIMAIGVEPAWQQRGIGVTLLREMEREAKRVGINILFLHTAEGNLPAQKLFIKMGFSLLKRKKRFYPEGQDAVLMFKSI
jgi:ribosomal-protein-alanine N-acetyltransferase